MKKLLMLLAIMTFAGLVMAQQYTEGTGITGVDKLGAHQNGGRGCVGCHAPHSGARGNGGNAATDGGAVTDDETGNLALWGQDLGPLYGQALAFGAEGAFNITLPGSMSVTGTAEQELTGIVMCLSCHDGNLAKGAMMTNKSWEQEMGLLPATYGPQLIPTLLGNDGTPAGNYHNDHPVGPKATLGAVGVASRLDYVGAATGTCTAHGHAVDCLQPKASNNTAFMAFYNNYGAFNITQSTTAFPSGGRTTGVVIPTSNPADAYLVCTTCHTPHSMYTFSGKVKGSSTTGTYPTYFFVSAPYNPGATPAKTQASSATQFCRQCHFTGAGGSNEGSGITTVTTKF
jgi:hypothetical protein